MNEGPHREGCNIPCSQADRKLFAAATTITIGDGKKISFWDSGWVSGQRPRDVAPNLFRISRRKNRTFYDTVTSDAWIRDLNLLHRGFSVAHFIEYHRLWVEVTSAAKTGSPGHHRLEAHDRREV